MITKEMVEEKFDYSKFPEKMHSVLQAYKDFALYIFDELDSEGNSNPTIEPLIRSRNRAIFAMRRKI